MANRGGTPRKAASTAYDAVSTTQYLDGSTAFFHHPHILHIFRQYCGSGVFTVWDVSLKLLSMI